MRTFFLVLLLISLIGACGQRYPQPRTKATGPHKLYAIPVHEAPLQFEEPILSLDETTVEHIYYVDHRQQRLSSGQIRVMFNLFNRSEEEEIWLEWKAVFYDGSNFQIDDTGWRELFMPRREVVTLKVSSLSKRAKNYTLLLRTPGRMAN